LVASKGISPPETDCKMLPSKSRKIHIIHAQ
jgi:hypothetical protein